MKRIPTLTFFLEMRRPCVPEVGPPDQPVHVERIRKPSVEFYRFLYNSVGKDYHWVDRNVLSDEALRRIIEDDAVEICVLTVEGQPAGFAELDRRKPPEIELAYFGLFPAFIGKGLGRYFLCWTLARAWSCTPSRVWVHTCDLDHPAALNSYLKAGFTLFDQKIIHQPIPPEGPPVER